MLVLECFQSADAAADQHAEAVAIDLFEIDPGIPHGAFRRSHGEMGETIGPLVFLGIIENRFRIEILNLAGDAAIVAGGVEARDLDNAASSFEQVLPQDFQLVA